MSEYSPRKSIRNASVPSDELFKGDKYLDANGNTLDPNFPLQLKTFTLANREPTEMKYVLVLGKELLVINIIIKNKY